jgi:hypothetical protein
MERTVTDHFEVSAEWMKACGFGQRPTVFNVRHTYEQGGWLFAVLDNGTAQGWTVLTDWRGRFVPPVTTGETGPDWEPTPATAYYAQRGDDGPFMFGPTPEAAQAALERAESEATLFAINTTAHKLGSVRGVESATGTGVYHPIQKRSFVPDMAAVRECLPHYWRKAFDRSGGQFWMDSRGRFAADEHRRYTGNVPYLRLNDSRGKYLATIYATPYVFSAKGPQA